MKKKKDITLDLETNQEEILDNLKLQSQQSKKTINNFKQNLYDLEEDDEEIEEDYKIEDTKQVKNEDKISEIIVGLLLKNVFFLS